MYFSGSDASLRQVLHSWDEVNGVQLLLDFDAGGSGPQDFTPWDEDRLVYHVTIDEAGTGLQRLAVYNITSNSLTVLPRTSPDGENQ